MDTKEVFIQPVHPTTRGHARDARLDNHAQDLPTIG